MSAPKTQTASRPKPQSIVLAAGRPAPTVAFESDVVDFFIGTTELLGVPKSLAAIYGIVFASPTPVSFADIGARLVLSKGSISQGLRTLREVGAIIEVSKPADPAELFAPDLEMRRLIGRYLSAKVNPQFKSGHLRLNSLQDKLALLPPSSRTHLNGRVRKLQRWHVRTRGLLPVIKTFLKVSF